MKLLFDHNLPPLLVSQLAALFPDSQHVFTIGLAEVSDLEIREFARQAITALSLKMLISVTYVSCSGFHRKLFGFVGETAQQKHSKSCSVNIATQLIFWKLIRRMEF